MTYFILHLSHTLFPLLLIMAFWKLLIWQYFPVHDEGIEIEDKFQNQILRTTKALGEWLVWFAGMFWSKYWSVWIDHVQPSLCFPTVEQETRAAWNFPNCKRQWFSECDIIAKKQNLVCFHFVSQSVCSMNHLQILSQPLPKFADV